MDRETLISIIVPVYNVEDYVRKCLDSIINQTYKNIEIIIVNDGSTDNSLKICKEYSKKDNRIILIDQNNQGLSSARNNGIKKSHGQYIGFVDSDDVISPYMYEYLYKAIKEDNSNISICDYTNFDKKEPSFDKEYTNYKLTNIEALQELMIDKKITNYAVNKLYLKSLFDDIEYPIGKKFEDIATTYKLFKKSQVISFVDCKLYGYYQREGSITKKYNKDSTRDFIESVSNRYNDLYNYNQNLNDYLTMNRTNYTLRYFLDIVLYKRIDVFKDKKYMDDLGKELKFVKDNYNKKAKNINTRGKNLLLRILFINKYLFYYLVLFYENISRRKI